MKRRFELSRILSVLEIGDEEGPPALRSTVVRSDPKVDTPRERAFMVELRNCPKTTVDPDTVGWDARWRINVHQSDTWARGIRPVTYQILDETTLTVIASVSVKGRSTFTVLGLLASLTEVGHAPRFISTLDLDLIQDERFQEWVWHNRIRVLFLGNTRSRFAGLAE